MELTTHSGRIQIYETLYPDSERCEVGKLASDHDGSFHDVKRRSLAATSYNPLYGEITRVGLNMLFQRLYSEINERYGLIIRDLESLADLGCGIGKLVVAAFLFYGHLKRVHGIELSRGRFDEARNTVKNLAMFLLDGKDKVKYSLTCSQDEISLTCNERTLTLTFGNLFDVAKMDMTLYIADFAFDRTREMENVRAFVAFILKTKPGTYFLMYEALGDRLQKQLKQDELLETLKFPRIKTTWGNHSFQVYRRMASTVGNLK